MRRCSPRCSASTGRRRRQLLRPRRPLAAGDPAGQPGPLRARRRADHPRAVRRPRPSPRWPHLLDAGQQHRDRRYGRRPRPDRLPLSFAQRRLWFLARLGPSATYNIPFGWRLHRRARPRRAARRARRRGRPARGAAHDLPGRGRRARTSTILAADEASAGVTVVRTRRGRLAALTEQAARYTFDLARELPVRAWLFGSAPTNMCCCW